MLRLALVMVLLLSCGKVENGRDGVDGSVGERGLIGSDGRNGRDGTNFYSYMVGVSLQEIIGDGHDEVVELSESSIYQLPKSFDVNVDNLYPECKLRDFELAVESESGVDVFTFQPTENRYKMQLKSGPVNKVVDSSFIKVYYKSVPEVDCGDVVYRLHSGVSFQVRVIQPLEID